MITIKESIKINRPPKDIAKWLNHFVENYKEWHPGHVSAEWLEGKDFEVDSVLYIEEDIGGIVEKLRLKVTKNRKNRYIEYKTLFPESLLFPGGSFEIKPYKGGTIFTATLSFKGESVASRIFGDRIKAIKKHMKEEGRCLKKIVEKQNSEKKA